MRTSTIVMIAIAVVFGVLAVIVSQTWLNRQAELRMRNLETPKRVVSTRTVVVAKSPLRFGTVLTPQLLREVEWPDEAIPEGSFASAEELTAGGKRAVLRPFERNEPIVSVKITGPGQKATLSAIIEDGMKAVTVRVNDIDGVAGFVLPGDRVDVLVTRQLGGEGGAGEISDVVLQNVRVLGVDQQADDRLDQPVIAKAVTLEVDIVAAQKLTLAASVGHLSLVLRRAGDTAQHAYRRVTTSEIGAGVTQASADSPRGGRATVNVIHPDKNAEYSVPIESIGKIQASGSSGARMLP